MLERFAKYFLDNRKITLVVITAISFFGILSYALLPKQYNPSIVAPAFEITVPVRGYSSADAGRFVVREIENRMAELPSMDTVYGYAGDEFASVMVSFEVGTDAEAAKTRVYDKLASDYSFRPFGVESFSVRSIDPEELPQVSFAVRYAGATLSEKEAGIYVRAVANLLKDRVKSVPDSAGLDLVGGYSNVVSVELHPERLRAYALTPDSVVGALRSAAGYRAVGTLEDGTRKTVVALDGGTETPESVAAAVVGNRGGADVFLRDVATISRGPSDPASYSFVLSKTSTGILEDDPAAFLGVAKVKGSNAVTVVDGVLEAVERFRKELPSDVRLDVVQNEGETAREATNELLFHLFLSIGIVFVVLVLFLGLKNAANAAFCIPMVLGIVFVVALIAGLDINRITLFALILSLGILVDDSIVVVENNARHLAERKKRGVTKKEAILASVREVGVSIVLSTVTRIASFLAMFAVTGMMGDYMKPIPVFAAIALTASLFVAFSINPFLAHVFSKHEGGHHEEVETPLLSHYARLLSKFVGEGERETRRRRWLKPAFWISLALVVVLPVATDVFRARMLPKADKNQVYLWIDLPRDRTAAESARAAKLAGEMLLDAAGKLPAELRIAESVSAVAGEAFLPDFANLFRGAENRKGTHQSSLRVNLVPAHDRGLSSERYVIAVRPILREAVLAEFPDATVRLLEDPPGPPTMATLHLKIKGQEGLPLDGLTKFAEAVAGVVRGLDPSEGVVDLADTFSRTLPKLRVKFDHERASDRNVDVAAAEAALAAALSDSKIGTLRSDGSSPEAEEIVVSVPKKFRGDPSYVRAVTVSNRMGEPVRLDEIASFEADFSGRDRNTENRSETVHLYAEIGDNSVVYPVLTLYSKFDDGALEAAGYRKISATPYGIRFVGLSDGKEYRVEWGGEWELTMDTFRDMGLAMVLSLLFIYFLVVAEFKSFRAGGIVMMTFLFSFFGIFPGFSLLNAIDGTYFTATAMIGAIALGGIVVGNAIILLDYVTQLIESGIPLERAVVEGSKKRVVPVLLTSVAAVLGSIIIAADPVWSGLAWAIAFGLSASAALTLFLVPVFFYDLKLRHPHHDPHASNDH